MIKIVLFCSLDVNINIAEDENEEEIIEKRRKQREELLKVHLHVLTIVRIQNSNI